MGKTALLVVDMQNDFCLPDGKLCVGGAMKCLPNVIEAVNIARSHQIPVIWVVREHDVSGVDAEKYRTNIKAVVKGTEGAQFVKGLQAAENEYIISKSRFSAFFATNLDLILRRLGITQIVLAGVQTPNCIRATAVDGMAYDYEVLVLADATASADDTTQRNNLSDMERFAGIKIMETMPWKKTYMYKSNYCD